MIIPENVKPGQAVKAAHMNTLLSTLRMVRDRVLPRGSSGNDNTISLPAFWADISYNGTGMEADIEQAYVHDLAAGANIAVFRHPLEQIKEFVENDVFELVIYASGSTVDAVRFVAEGEDDFDLQTIADALTAAGDPVPQDLTDAITAAASDNLSGTKYRLKVLKFIHPVVVEADPGPPVVAEVKQWDVIHYCKNDVLWGASGSDCILGNLSEDTVNGTEQSPKVTLGSGFVTGGGNSVLVTPDNLTETIGDYVWLEVAWTAIDDGGLQPGGTMGAITVGQGNAVPTDTIPVVGSLSGTAHIPLGSWVSDNADPPDGPNPVWVGQGCGAIQVYFCPGGFFFGRGNVIAEGGG